MHDRIALWKNAFEGDDNSVVTTLTTCAWNHAAFMSIWLAVQAAPEAPDGRKRLNFLTLDLLSECYWASFLMAMRRMVDRGPLRGPKGVCSLGAIIGDARGCRERFTRTLFLEVAGLPYDWQAVRAANVERLTGRLHWMTREQDFFSSMERHALFDRLSGVHEADRSPSDVMRLEVFDLLDAKLQRLADIADHASIHFAHAASAESRQGRGLDAWGLERSKEALQSLIETAELVGRWFLSSGVGDILPVPQYDQFAFMDQPLANAEAIETLRDAWHAFGRETTQWHMVDAPESWA